MVGEHNFSFFRAVPSADTAAAVLLFYWIMRPYELSEAPEMTNAQSLSDDIARN